MLILPFMIICLVFLFKFLFISRALLDSGRELPLCSGPICLVLPGTPLRREAI